MGAYRPGPPRQAGYTALFSVLLGCPSNRPVHTGTAHPLSWVFWGGFSHFTDFWITTLEVIYPNATLIQIGFFFFFLTEQFLSSSHNSWWYGKVSYCPILLVIKREEETALPSEGSKGHINGTREMVGLTPHQLTWNCAFRKGGLGGSRGDEDKHRECGCPIGLGKLAGTQGMGCNK